VAIGNIIDNDKTSRFTLEIADQAIDPLLTTFVERPNFKTRIHAA